MKTEQQYHNGTLYCCEVIHTGGRFKAQLIKIPSELKQKKPIRSIDLEKEEFFGDTDEETMAKCKRRMNEVLGEENLEKYKSFKK